MNYNLSRKREFSRSDRVATAASLLADRACSACLRIPHHAKRYIASVLDPEMAHSAELAYVDVDTGLPNKRAMHRRFGELIAEGVPFAAIMIDINHFKSVNEQVGHSRADEILAVYAQKIKAQTRAEDELYIQKSTTFRTGGDEFYILAPLTAHEDTELTDDERLDRFVARLNNDYLETDSVMSTSDEIMVITATAYGEVVNPEECAADDMSLILNNISLNMLAQKRA